MFVTFILSYENRVGDVIEPGAGRRWAKITTVSSHTVDLAPEEILLTADFGVVDVVLVAGINTARIALMAPVLLLIGALAILITTVKRREQGDLEA